MAIYYTYAAESDGQNRGIEGYKVMQDCIDACREDFFYFLIVWGLKGVEKSNFDLAFTHDLLRRLYPNMAESEIWKWVLNLIVFDIPTFDVVKKEGRDGSIGLKIDGGFKKAPIINWDDIGMYFGKRAPLTTERERFLREFHAIREDLAVLIGSTPDLEEPAKGLRVYTHEIFFKSRGWGFAEQYEKAINPKRAGQSQTFKVPLHFIRCARIPANIYNKYRAMKLDAKQRLEEARQRNFTPADIRRLIETQLGFERDRQIFEICYAATRGRRGFATTRETHELYKEHLGRKEPYDGYLTGVYRYLHGVGVIMYRVRGKHGEVTLTDKGEKCIELLMKRNELPIGIKIRPKIHT